jgi:hypothetical protein
MGIADCGLGNVIVVAIERAVMPQRQPDGGFRDFAQRKGGLRHDR